jgi:hypothetical protein
MRSCRVRRLSPDLQAGSYKLVLARGCGDVVAVDIGNAVPFVVAIRTSLDW